VIAGATATATTGTGTADLAMVEMVSMMGVLSEKEAHGTSWGGLQVKEANLWANVSQPLDDLPHRGVAEQLGGTASAAPSASLTPLTATTRRFVTTGSVDF
jgi:hypothetical protein